MKRGCCKLGLCRYMLWKSFCHPWKQFICQLRRYQSSLNDDSVITGEISYSYANWLQYYQQQTANIFGKETLRYMHRTGCWSRQNLAHIHTEQKLLTGRKHEATTKTKQLTTIRLFILLLASYYWKAPLLLPCFIKFSFVILAFLLLAGEPRVVCGADLHLLTLEASGYVS